MESIELNFRYETKTIKFLMRSFFFLIHLAIMTEIVATPKFRLFIRLLFFLWLAKPYYSTIKHRYYTYWSFSALLFCYLLFKIYEQFYILDNEHIGILYLISTLILVFKMYLLSSPIYYPVVSWWEYDFRYRDDLKISIKSGENEFAARLTDLRRQAGCVASFSELKLGEEIVINAALDEDNVLLRGVVMSKRRDVIGRPIIYGVQFKFDSKSNKKRYIHLERLWKKQKNNKRKMKFAHD
nr:PilZ domain-containing protein [Bacteriovorax sp. HI3]